MKDETAPEEKYCLEASLDLDFDPPRVLGVVGLLATLIVPILAIVITVDGLSTPIRVGLWVSIALPAIAGLTWLGYRSNRYVRNVIARSHCYDALLRHIAQLTTALEQKESTHQTKIEQHEANHKTELDQQESMHQAALAFISASSTHPGRVRIVEYKPVEAILRNGQVLIVLDQHDSPPLAPGDGLLAIDPEQPALLAVLTVTSEQSGSLKPCAELTVCTRMYGGLVTEAAEKMKPLRSRSRAYRLDFLTDESVSGPTHAEDKVQERGE